MRFIPHSRWQLAGAAIGGALAAVAILVCALLMATRHVPDFYRQAMAADAAQARKGSDELLESATALMNSARKQGTWYLLVTEEQINGWLAVDLVQNHPDLLPPNMADPRVHLETDRATIACNYRSPGLSAVISVAVDVYLVEPQVVALQVHAARAGSLPVPIKPIVDGIAHVAERMNLRVQWRQAHGEPVVLITLPSPHHETGAHGLDALKLRDREIYLSGSTEAPADVESPSPGTVEPQPDVATRPEENRKVH